MPRAMPGTSKASEVAPNAATPARMIAVDVSWQEGRAPLLVRATNDLAESVEAIRAALDDPSEPFRLVATVDGLEVEPTAGVWGTLLGREGTLPVFRAISDCSAAAAVQPQAQPCANAMTIPAMLDAQQLENREHVYVETLNRGAFAVRTPTVWSAFLTQLSHWAWRHCPGSSRQDP